MESTTFNTGRLVWIIAATGICATLVAFNQKQQTPKNNPVPQASSPDTIPKKKERKIRNLDEALQDRDDRQLEINLENLHAELAEIGPQVQKEIANAKIEIKKALREIDVAGINVEVKEAIEKIDWQQIHREINELKEINLDKLNVDMKNVQVELQKIKPVLEKNLVTVKVELEKAKAELKEYNTFIDGLNQDGLIDKKDDYTIRHKNGELIINGKKQPEQVYTKYRAFLEKHKNVTIEKSDDGFNVNSN